MRQLTYLFQGLERNDFILEFGHLDGDNSLADVGQLVAESEGVGLFAIRYILPLTTLLSVRSSSG